MTHNFSDDERNYLTPDVDKGQDEDGGKGEPGTEAVAFDPFADDDDEFPDASHNAADAEVAALLRQVGAGDVPAGKDAAGDNTAGGDGDTGAATEAVAFDQIGRASCRERVRMRGQEGAMYKGKSDDVA